MPNPDRLPGSPFEEKYFEDPDYPPGLKGGDEVGGYGYYPDYFAIIQAQLSALVELSGAASLLDVGCGKGALAEYARRDLGLRVVGCDLSAYAIRRARARPGGEFSVRAACSRLPFPDDAFDLVWCNGVLQYLEAPEAGQALAEMARLARQAAFVSNIAAAQRHTEWGRRDRLTRLYLRPRQWELMARAAGAAGATALPFEGESAILLTRPGRVGGKFPLRFAELSLARQLRLGCLPRMPPGMAGFRKLFH